jgi:hypothetical protein
MLKEILDHAGLDAANKFVINRNVWAFFAMTNTKASPNFDAGGQIVLTQKTFYNFSIDVVSAGKAGTSHADCDDRIRFIHFAAPAGIV